jgi:uncharacterized membrane protein YdjX (TVP38/TMEM64 family)
MPVKKKRDYTVVIITIVMFAFSIYLIVLAARHEKMIEHVVTSAGAFGPIVTILLYGLLSLTPIPSDPLTLLSGVLFGPIFGIFISWMGNNFAAMVEYYVGKSVSTITDFEEKKKHLPFGLAKLPVNSMWFLICGRFVPGLGPKIVSVLAGVYEINPWRYLASAAISNILGSILYALWGLGIFRLV